MCPVAVPSVTERGAPWTAGRLRHVSGVPLAEA